MLIHFEETQNDLVMSNLKISLDKTHFFMSQESFSLHRPENTQIVRFSNFIFEDSTTDRVFLHIIMFSIFFKMAEQVFGRIFVSLVDSQR